MITHNEEYRTKIVGVTFKNEDGTPRQEVIELCNEGDALSLEHYYYKDEDAFKVTNLYGEVLGNLKKELSEKLIEKYDIATIEAAEVEILNITGEDKGTLGVNIQIVISDEVAPAPRISTASTVTPIATKQASNPIESLYNKYGTQKLKTYSLILKIVFIISLLFALFALVFSIPFAVIFGVIAFICYKYSKLYKKAANYSK